MPLTRKHKRIIAAVAGSTILLFLIITIAASGSHDKNDVNYFKGAVVANGLECAEIGGAILSQGGSAADSAIATLFCEGVTCPQSMGLGGGFLMVIYDRSKRKAEFLNARETAPIKSTKDMFVEDPKLSIKGGLSIAVPGELKGYWELHKKYGKLPWKTLIEPTIKLCKEGHLVTPYLARIFARMAESIKKEPSMREIYIDPKTNEIYKEGDKVKRIKLAESLEYIAEEGVDSLYSKNGTLLPRLLEDIKAFNGILIEEDFLNYNVRWENLSPSHLGSSHEIYSSPLPGSGPLLSFIFNVLNQSNIKNTPAEWLKIIEVFKFAYGMRTKLGDPYFVNKLNETLVGFLSNEHANEIRKIINDQKQTNSSFSYYGADFTTPDDHGTAHVSVLAPNGDAISATSTINYIFGAMLRSSKTGIILNDEMDDFANPNAKNAYGLPPSPANYIQPGKRPLSSMTPTIVTDNEGNVKLNFGAAGGAKITLSLANVLLHHLYFNKTIQEAIEERRIYHLIAPMKVQYERYYDQHILDELSSFGHVLEENPPEFGFTAITAVANDSLGIHAVFDSRRGGSLKIVEVQNI